MTSRSSCSIKQSKSPQRTALDNKLIEPKSHESKPKRVSLRQRSRLFWQRTLEQFDSRRRYAMFFLPGTFLVALGLAVIFTPGLVLGVLAAFFVFSGVVITWLAWKLIVLSQKFEHLAKQFEARIYIHGVNMKANPSAPVEEAQDKTKIVYH